jgi:hypothetical protein
MKKMRSALGTLSLRLMKLGLEKAEAGLVLGVERFPGGNAGVDRGETRPAA